MNLCFKCKKEVTGTTKHGLHENCFKEWFNLVDAEDDFKDIYQPKSGYMESQSYENTFFHGNFKKYSATLGKHQYILKPTGDYPELAKTEDLCNQLAVSAGLEVSQFHLIHFMEKEDCFLSYNFMQDYQGASLVHIYHFIEKGDHTLETILKVIELETQRLSELKKIINLCLFDSLVGNNDRHGRNIGLISTPSGYIVSPCYDNTSDFATEEENFLGANLNPKGCIKTSFTTEPMIVDYVQELIRLGYKSEVNEFAKQVNISELKLLIEESFLSNKRKTAILNFIIKQYEELLNAL